MQSITGARLTPNQDKPVGANWSSLSATTQQGENPDLSGNKNDLPQSHKDTEILSYFFLRALVSWWQD